MKKEIIFCLLLFPFFTNAQSLLEKMTLKVGIAKSEVDTRISPKHFKEEHTLDDEYFFNLSYQQPIYKKLEVIAGLGYSLMVNDYNVFVNNLYFVRAEEDLHTVGTYYKHQLQPSIALNYPILEKKDFTYSAGVLLNYNLYINKSIRNGFDGFTFSKWLFESSSMELYPTANIDYKRFSLEIGYRIFNRNYKDEAIQTFSPNATSLQETFLAAGDNYNPIKFRLALGYRLR